MYICVPVAFVVMSMYNVRFRYIHCLCEMSYLLKPEG